MNAVTPLSQNFQTKILDNLNTAVLITNAQLSVEYLNSAAEELLGTSIRMAHQLNLADIQVNDGPKSLRDYFQDKKIQERSYTYREIRIHSNGNEHVVDCTITPIYNDSNAPDLLVEFNRVDRLLKIAQEEELISQHLAAREIARGLAHEINNPLGGLRGAAQLLEREIPDDCHEYTQVIINESDRLQTLVSRMLGPRSLPQKTSINIHEVLDHVIKLLRAEDDKRVTIKLDIDPSIPNIMADGDQLIQAILNILRNAIQALEKVPNGHITLSTRIMRSFTIGHTFHKLLLRLDVIDNGPGIPTDKLKQIFYPMVTSRSEGTGLGLTIAQSLISFHGGLIECTSKPGKTVFSILLPFNHSMETLNGQAG